jgi:Tfp pilus assembly protein PilN
MKATEMNLASRPFVNEQPVIRTSVLLWVLGVALLALNITLYYRHIEGRGEQQELLRVADERLIQETEAIERLRAELTDLNLEKQNEQVRFLNSQIALRTFSWSALFDLLAEVVPAAIQMEGISPNIVEVDSADRRGRLTGSTEEVVKVDLQGTSRSPEAALELVDALFAHPSFLDPNLTRESFSEGQENSFVLSVLYLPGRASEEDPTPSTPVAEPFEVGVEDSVVEQEADQDTVVESLETVEGSE